MLKISQLVEEIKSGVPTLSRAEIALLTSNGQILYSELGSELENIAKGELARSFKYWGIGDYFVKHLGRENLIVGKVSSNLAIAICSMEKIGLLILAFTTVKKRFGDSFREIESKVRLPEAEEIEEEVVEVKPPEEIAVETPIKPKEEEVKVEEIEISLSPWTVLEPFSSIQTSTVTMDKDMITLLRLIDGWKTIEDLSKEANMPLETTLQKLSYLVSRGVVKSKYDDPVYQKRPKLLGKVKIEAAFMSFGAALGKARSLGDILKLVDGERTILDIARELGARPEVLKTLLQNLEKRKILELT